MVNVKRTEVTTSQPCTVKIAPVLGWYRSAHSLGCASLIPLTTRRRPGSAVERALRANRTGPAARRVDERSEGT